MTHYKTLEEHEILWNTDAQTVCSLEARQICLTSRLSELTYLQRAVKLDSVHYVGHGLYEDSLSSIHNCMLSSNLDAAIAGISDWQAKNEESKPSRLVFEDQLNPLKIKNHSCL